MSNRRLPANQSRGHRQSSGWLWLLVSMVLLAAWYWFDRSADPPAPPPSIAIESRAAQATGARPVDRPGREPRRPERSGSERPDDDRDAGGSPAEPAVPLSPRS